MSNHSPHPNSLSPIKQSSAFQWPIPPSPSTLKPMNTSSSQSSANDITVKEILDRYNEDPELLKYILTAKSEEDKKKAARDTLKAEEARIQLRQMDLEFAREQSKRQGYPTHTYGPHPQQAQVQPIQAPHMYPYYGLAPVQQQVLARFNYPPQYGPQGQHGQPPPSPSIPYPHSAHPLCPPTTMSDEKARLQPQSQLRQVSPTSPINEESSANKNLKRNRSSISSMNEPNEQDKISHNKVMEALKAKIQRSNGGPPSPSPLNTPTIKQDFKKRKANTLPRPVVIQESSINKNSTSSPSPRSAKPILPPIDTNLGRINMGNTKPTTDSSSHSSQNEEDQNNEEEYANDDTTTTTTTTTNNNTFSNKNKEKDTTYSPSDHILLNTRRVRSLSTSNSSASLITKEK